jgi:hypothetical protein
MRKLSLNLDQLSVDSFETDAAGTRMGTVRGAAYGPLDEDEAIAEPVVTVPIETIIRTQPATCGASCGVTCATCNDPTCNSCHATACWTGNSPVCCA